VRLKAALDASEMKREEERRLADVQYEELSERLSEAEAAALIGNGSGDGGGGEIGTSTEEAEYLKAVNSRLQTQLSLLTEQRTTLSDGLQMVQEELDAEHDKNNDLRQELARVGSDGGGGGQVARSTDISFGSQRQRVQSNPNLNRNWLVGDG